MRYAWLGVAVLIASCASSVQEGPEDVGEGVCHTGCTTSIKHGSDDGGDASSTTLPDVLKHHHPSLLHVESVLFKQYPKAWDEIQRAFVNRSGDFDPRGFRSKVRWQAMRDLSPREFALMVNAASREADGSLPYFYAAVVADYAWSSKEHVREVLRFQFYASPYQENAVQNICLNPMSFDPIEDSDLWRDAEAQAQEMDEPYRSIVPACSRVGTGRTINGQVRRLIDVIEADSNWTLSTEVIQYLVTFGSKATRAELDECVAGAIQKHHSEVEKYSHKRPIHGASAAALLFKVGHSKSLARYARYKTQKGSTHSFDVTMALDVASAVIDVECPLDTSADISSHYTAEDGGESTRRTIEFMRYISEGEFDECTWHDGLQSWIARES